MAASPDRITIECPRCGHRYADHERGSIEPASAHPISGDREFWKAANTTNCPKCAAKTDVNLLIVDRDEVWRLSPFAQQVADPGVAASSPPGGQIAYAAKPRRPQQALTAAQSEARRRALSVIEGRSHAGVGARREALQLALRGGLLDDDEISRARACLRALADGGD